MGVSYTLTDLTPGSSTTQTYSLVLNTAGYSHHADPSFLDSVNIKAWGAGSADMSFSLLSAPGGVGAWSGTEGPISNGGTSGCGSSGAGFACVEAVNKGVFNVDSGTSYEFRFQVTATDATSFLTSSAGAHVGAGYAGISGDGRSYGITSITAPIPEPGTYVMMLAGLGLMGFVARRRRV